MEEYKIRVKPITSPPKTPKEPQGRDTFETPNYAVDLLIPFIPSYIYAIWECAVGGGKIKRRIADVGRFLVYGTDIRSGPEVDEILNFVTDPMPTTFEPNCIVTNPPYSIKDMFIEKAFEYGIPFAFLINADYHAKHISWIERGCEKIIPNRRIDFITPTGRQGSTSASQFHSMWLTFGFNLGRTETFVDLPIKDKKENI